VRRINELLVKHTSIAKIAQEYNLGYDALYRHSCSHVPKKLMKVFEKQELAETFDLMGKLDFLIKETEDIYNVARQGGKDLLALKSLDSLRNHYQLLINISAQLHAQKVLELEMLKLQHAETQDHMDEEAAEQLKRLTFDELKEYYRLVNKMCGVATRRTRPLQQDAN
jgi:hypothetical protein